MAAVHRSPVPHRTGGFTLLELLVVLVLIGILVSVAVLSLGDGGRGENIRREAKRMIALFSLASEEAVLNAREYGVQFNADGYRFLHLADGRWVVLTEDTLLAPRRLPEAMTLELYLDGVAVGLTQREEVKVEPDLLFYSSAERTPFELLLSYHQVPQHEQRISGPPVGPFDWRQPEARR